MPQLFNQLLNSGLIRALCWTLVHSLWQGLVLAIIAGIIVLLTKKSGPGKRYKLFSTLFLAFFLVAGYTFIKEWEHHSRISYTVINAAPSVHTGTATLPVELVSPVADPPPSLADAFIQYFNQHAALIVATWFIFFSARLVKIISGLGHIQRIKHYNIYPPSGEWTARLSQLATQLSLRQPVRLMESAIVKVPAAVGFLKPVILMPLGMLAQLPPDQVEAILLHELAHIKRKDYFINLLQSFAEAIFFFNPAILWISSLIKEERENCCDDLAISITKSKSKFVEALVSFQEYNTRPSSYAMTFPGKKNQLLNRVKRILHNNNPSLTGMERAFLITCFVLTAMLTLVYAQSVKPKPPKNSNPVINIEQNNVLPANTDTIPVKNHPKSHTATHPVKRNDTDTTSHPIREVNPSVSVSPVVAPTVKPTGIDTQTNTVIHTNVGVLVNGNTKRYFARGYEVVQENGRVTWIYFQGKQLPNDQPDQYNNIITSVVQEAVEKVEADKRVAQQDARKREEDRSIDQNDQEAFKADLSRADERKQIQSEVRRLQKDLATQRSKLAALDAEQTSHHQNRIQTNKNNSQLNTNQSLFWKDYNLKAPLYQLSNVELKTTNRNNTLNRLVSTLIEEKVLKDDQVALSIQLDDTKLIVNGIQQPESLRRKLKDKYLPEGKISFEGTRKVK